MLSLAGFASSASLSSSVRSVPHSLSPGGRGRVLTRAGLGEGRGLLQPLPPPPACSSASSLAGPPFLARLPLRRQRGGRGPAARPNCAPAASRITKVGSTRAAGGEGGSAQEEKAGRQAWDFGRFLNTVLYFNPLDELARSVVARLTGQGGEAGAQAQEGQRGQPRGSRLVLVTGATGGVGRRVTALLQQAGVPVRALVRNEDKARRLLGNEVPLVLADVAQPATLVPGDFQGVTHVINCLAVTVGPKEGDTEDRAKYYQGIKFYDPETKGETPEAVEFRGLLNLLHVLKPHLGLTQGLPLFSVAENGMPVGAQWGALDDVVMGGVSLSSFQVDLQGGESGQPVGVFQGTVSTANSGGFASVRTRNFSSPVDLSPYGALALRLKGDGQRYKLILRTTSDWDSLGYTTSFDTNSQGEWETVLLPFSSFVPVFRAKTVSAAPPFSLACSSLYSIQLMLSKFEYDGKLNPNFNAGPFQLRVDSISALLPEPVCPRFVHVGSAGVTRPGRPGLDLSKQPPAVRMNDELGGILSYKLAGEDAIRSSGVPFCIVRPCALTEEPAGAPLIFDQGDNITGKIGREEVARICIAALDSPDALDKTFEVKSTIPFSQPFTVDPASPPEPADYTPFFKALKAGVTGKELLVA